MSEREREINVTSVSLCVSQKCSVALSLVIVKLKVNFLHSAVVVTSLVRSHVVFKLLNYVTDKIVRVALTTLALMLTCVQICASVRERERER